MSCDDNLLLNLRKHKINQASIEAKRTRILKGKTEKLRKTTITYEGKSKN